MALQTKYKIETLAVHAGQRPDPATAIGRARLAICEKLARLGLLARLDDGAYALTARGREVADGVMAEFD